MAFSKCIPLALVAFTTSSAFAARAPDAVEKAIEFAGPEAKALGSFFGVTLSDRRFVTLRLGRGDEWAIYLLKHDTHDQLWNDNVGMPERYNTVEFLESGAGFVISPYWLNLGTRLPKPETGAYSFGSPFLAQGGAGDEPWRAILGRLKAEPGWDLNKQIQWTRCFTASDTSKMCIDVYADDSYIGRQRIVGNVIVITASQAKK